MSYPYWIADPRIRAVVHANNRNADQIAGYRRHRVDTYILRRTRSGSGRQQPSLQDLRDWPIEDLQQLASRPGTHPESMGGLPPAAGIYFLWIDHEMVYIGQSVNLRTRLRYHRRAAAKGYEPWEAGGWNKATWIEVPEETLNAWEVSYIVKYRPRFNIALRPKDAAPGLAESPPLDTSGDATLESEVSP